MKINPYKILFLFFSMVLMTCEKDDICSADTSTTPRLIVTFHDISSPEDKKNVGGLFVYGKDDDNENVLFKNITVTNTDSIAIPLRTDSDLTKFVFQKDVEDISDLSTGNPENIQANYTREDIYVSRACGYKNIFTNLNISLEADTDNWIANIIIENTTVDNETTAHVKIFH